MIRPIRSTIVFGVLGALVLGPAAWLFAGFWGWPIAFKGVLWLVLAAYAIMLARWSGASPASLIFPLALLLGAALWPGAGNGFIWLTLGVLSWIRSGICFRRAPLRALTAELVTTAGGAGLVVMLWQPSAIAQALAVWLFFLCQTLYFFIMPVKAVEGKNSHGDTFEKARQDLERVLDSSLSS